MTLNKNSKHGVTIIATIIIFIFAAITFTIFWFLDHSEAQSHYSAFHTKKKKAKNVLVFLSAHATNSRTAQWLDEINHWGKAHPDFTVNFNVIELDVLRNQNKQDWLKKITGELSAIRNHRYDLIITLDNVALDYLIRKENQLPSKVPVVFSGYEKDPAELCKIHPNMTGVIENLDLAKNVELGMDLWPDTHEVIILSDSSSDSLAFENQAKTKLKKYNGLELTFLDNSSHSVSELFSILRKKERHAFLIFPPWRELAQSDYQTRSAMAIDLSTNLQIPYMVLTDELLGNGALGGYLVPVRELARKTAAVSSTVLTQKSAKGIPFMFQGPCPYFDYEAMEKFRVAKSALPEESRLINLPPGFWENNRRLLIGFSGLFILLTTAFASYAIAVNGAQKRSRALYAALPGRIGVLNKDEKILYLNTEDRCKADLKDVKFFRDIPDINYQKLSEAIKSVFETGKSITVDYEYKSVKRILAASLLNEKIFGEKTVVWFSQDNSALCNVIQNEKAIRASLSSVMLEHSFAGAFERIACTLNSQLNCDRVMLAKYNEDQKLRFYDEWHTSDIAALKENMPENHYRVWDLFTDKLRTGELIKFDDFTTSGFSEKYNLNGDGYTNLNSLIIAPILIEDHLWGALFVSFSKEKRLFSPSDEQLMYSMSDIIALAKIRENQQSEIKRSNFEKQIILDHVNIPIWLHDGNGELLQANNEVAKIAGVPSDLLNTQNNYDIFSKGFPAGAERPVPAVIRTHKPAQMTITFGGRDYITRSLPVFDEQQNLIYIVKSAIDVTELNAIVEMQRVVSFCLETFFSTTNSHDALEQVIKVICKYMDASRCFVMRFDTEKSEADNIAEYIRTGCNPLFRDVKKRHFNQNEPWFKTFVNHEMISWDNTKTQETIEFFGGWNEINEKTSSIHVIGIFLEGKFWGNIGITYDEQSHTITDDEKKFIRTAGRIVSLFLQRKKAQEQIILALKQAKNADKAKSFFIASVSHEIRTPLNAVIGFSELLTDEKMTPTERKEYLNNVIYSGKALLQLINDVLDLSKLEAGQMQIILESTDFSKLCHENLHLFEQTAQEKKLKLQTRISVPSRLGLDKLRIRQILFNLLGNAVKFTLHGSVTLWADFSSENKKTGTLRFGVTDTGIGIAKSDQVKLMEPFVQLSKMRGTNAANNGTGLGLSICKRLIERMNGKLSIESAVGKGSTFSVLLNDVEYDECNTIPELNWEKEKIWSKNMNSCALLLVDDVKMNLQVMSAMLRKIGIDDVTCASSGAEALELLGKRSFSMVMTDMWMPKMNGAELARDIHSQQQSRNLPVIAVTADVDAGVNFPMDDFAGVILKPVTIEKCAEVLKKI